jgi:hypothetical protein
MHLPALIDTKEKGMQFLIDNGVLPIFPGLFAGHVRTSISISILAKCY